MSQWLIKRNNREYGDIQTCEMTHGLRKQWRAEWSDGDSEIVVAANGDTEKDALAQLFNRVESMILGLEMASGDLEKITELMAAMPQRDR